MVRLASSRRTVPVRRKVVVAPRRSAPVSAAAVSEKAAAKAVQKVMNLFGATPQALAAANKQRLARASARDSAMSGALGFAGRAAAAYFGGPAAALPSIMGSGDYITSADPVKYNTVLNAGQIPQFSGGKNVTTIRHREYLGDIISSSSANTFQVQTFNINPGLSATFPWLSGVCGATYQQHRINGMVFEFRSTSADALNSVNTALGSVVMATDYDSADAAFTSKAQMENTEFGVSCKPSQSMIHAIECARNQTTVSEQYIRAFAVPTGADIRLYDLGKFYIATNGFQGTSVNCGELWVSYDVTLFKAIQQPPGFLTPCAHFALAPASLATAPFTVSTTVGTNFDNIGLVFAANGLSFTMPLSIPIKSRWLIIQREAGTAAAATIHTYGYSNGLNALGTFVGQASGAAKAPSPSALTGTTGTLTIGTFSYDGSGTPSALPTVTIDAAATPLASYSSGDLMLVMMSGNWQ
nr:putative capsid protein [Crucivirus sp.]